MKRHLFLCQLLAVAVAFTPAALRATQPGPGLTSPFEVKYLKDTIDHHFAALRMTELAAGTDATRDPQLSPAEGTSSTPGFPATPAKATLDQIKSMARQANRAQREEILRSQKLLRDWYGINYQPAISDVNRARIQILEEAAPGDQFNHYFLEVFSRHHFTIVVRSAEALTSAYLQHDELLRMARAILEGQFVQINDMRDLLCQQYGICDWQSYVGLKGKHTGDESELAASYNRYKNATRDEDEDNEDHGTGR